MFNPADGDNTPKQNCLAITPPDPFLLKRSLYHCDKHFMVADLLPMFQEHKSATSISYGVALVSGQEFEAFKLAITSPGSFEGQFVKAGKSQSTVQTKKQKKGGQSAQRFGRIRQEKRGVWVQKLIESLNEAYLDKDGRPTIKGLVLAGPSTLKQELLAANVGSHSSLLSLLGSAVHLFATPSIDSVALQKKALAAVHANMPTFFASAQHSSEEARWAEFTSASERGDASFGEREVREALLKCRLRLVLIAPSLPADLDHWDQLCVQSGAVMCVLSTLASRLADYGGVVGVPWFSQIEMEEEGDLSEFSDSEETGIDSAPINNAASPTSSPVVPSPSLVVSPLENTPPRVVPRETPAPVNVPSPVPHPPSRLRAEAPSFMPICA